METIDDDLAFWESRNEKISWEIFLILHGAYNSMTSMQKMTPQLPGLYTTFKFLKNPRKFKIFKTLVDKKEITTFDIAILLEERLAYVCDRLREFEKVGLAIRKGESIPFTTEAKAHVPSRSPGKYMCYEATDHAELIHRFFTAYSSDKPLANLSSLIKPEDVIKSCVQLERSEYLRGLQKFKMMHNLGSLLVCLYYASPNHSADCNVLSSFLSHRLDPEEINDVLSSFSGKGNLVLSRHAPLKAVDMLKQRIAGLLRGWVLTRWARQNRTTYSLTAEGKRIALRLTAEFRPQDLGIAEQRLKAGGVFEYKGIKNALLSDLVSLLIIIFLGLPIIVLAWIAAIALFTRNIIADIGRWRAIRE